MESDGDQCFHPPAAAASAATTATAASAGATAGTTTNVLPESSFSLAYQAKLLMGEGGPTTLLVMISVLYLINQLYLLGYIWAHRRRLRPNELWSFGAGGLFIFEVAVAVAVFSRPEMLENSVAVLLYLVSTCLILITSVVVSRIFDF